METASRCALLHLKQQIDMTGFTEMVTIEKAYQRMSVDGCEFIAKGANGAVYRYDDETIKEMLVHMFTGPKAKLVDLNIEALRRGAACVK